MIHEVARFDPTKRNLLALACLSAACAIGSLNYSTYWLWFLPKTQSFLPGLMSGLVAVLLLLPVIRLM